MINFDYVSRENIKEHNPKWPQIPDKKGQRIAILKSGKKEGGRMMAS